MANVPVATKPFKKTNYPASHPNRGQSAEGAILARREQKYGTLGDQVTSQPRASNLPLSSVKRIDSAGLAARTRGTTDMRKIGPYPVKPTPPGKGLYVTDLVGGQFTGMAPLHFSREEIDRVYGNNTPNDSAVDGNNGGSVADDLPGTSSAASGASASGKAKAGKTALKVGGGLGLGLSALSKVTDFAARMGDVSRKMMQGALNPSPLGTREFNNLADAAQGTMSAVQSGINGISDLNAKRKATKDNNRVADLEAIRSKYVEKLKNAPLGSDWGNIADEYMDEVNQYFADKKINPASIASNNIIAKQVNQTARELTNIAQRKKTAHNIELTDDVLDLRENANVARDGSKAARMQLRDINAESKKKFDSMWKNRVDINGVAISNEDYETLDLLANDVGDVNTAGEWTVGQRFDTSTYRKLANAAEQRMLKETDPVKSQHWANLWEKYETVVDNDLVGHDKLEYDLNDKIISDPNVSLVDKLQYMNKGKTRGYELNDIRTIADVGFVPNKNLINDARIALRRTEMGLKQQMDALEKVVPKTPGEKATIDKRKMEIKDQLTKVYFERDKLTPAFLLADIDANVFEKLEKTLPGSERQYTPRYIRGKDGAEIEGHVWFEALSKKTPRFELTDENLKEGLRSSVYQDIKMANAKLQKAWKAWEASPPDKKYDKKTGESTFKGMATQLYDSKGNPMIDKRTGQPYTIGMELHNKLAGRLEKYDQGLGLMHKHGIKVPENMKELTKAMGVELSTLTDMVEAQIWGGSAPPTAIPSRLSNLFMPSSGAITSASGSPLTASLYTKFNKDTFFTMLDANKSLTDFDRTKLTLVKWLDIASSTPSFQRLFRGALSLSDVKHAVRGYMGSIKGNVDPTLIQTINNMFSTVVKDPNFEKEFYKAAGVSDPTNKKRYKPAAISNLIKNHGL